MLEFPRLSTNAIAQYPFRHAVEFDTFRHRFLDRSEQRFRQRRVAARHWQVDLALLTQEETGRLRDFFSAMNGQLNEFLFTDPWTGQQYVSTLSADDLDLVEADISDRRTKLTVSSSEY
jgi:hypothetical protein